MPITKIGRIGLYRMELFNRCKRLFKIIDEQAEDRDRSNAIEAVFIFNRDLLDRNFFYITGLYHGVFENCGIIIDRECNYRVLTTALEEEIVREKFDDKNLSIYKNEEERNRSIHESLKRYRRVGIAYKNITYSYYKWLKESFPDIQWIDVSIAFKKLRMIKSEFEIAEIQHACDIASRVADMIPSFLKKGMTELELAAEVEYHMKLIGAQGIAFNTISAFGENSSKPHYIGGDVKLEDQSVVLVDFGAQYHGYVSDITQTILVGQPPAELIEIYKVVSHAQHIAFDMMRPGVNVQNVETEVRKYIDSHKNFKGRFIHSLGHSIGRDVHDDGYPGEEWDRLLQAGMVITVEPGIYIPGKYGVRLEDDVLIEENGCKVLTSADKELIIHAIL